MKGKACLAFIALFTVGCSDNLSERTAAKLLEEQLAKLPVSGDVVVGKKGFISGVYKTDKQCSDLLSGSHRLLIENGYVSVKDGGISKVGWSEQRECDIVPTQKLEQFVLKKSKWLGSVELAQVKLADKKLTKVISITEPATAMGVIISKVTYEYTLERTALGLLLMKDADANTPVKRVQEFVKYKDGWGLPSR